MFFDNGDGGCFVNIFRGGESWWSKFLFMVFMRLVMSEFFELCFVLLVRFGWEGCTRGAGDSFFGCGFWCWGIGGGGGGGECCFSGLWIWCWLLCWFCFGFRDFLFVVWFWVIVLEFKIRGFVLLVDCVLVLLEVFELFLVLTFFTLVEFLLLWLLCGWIDGLYCLWFFVLGRDDELFVL